MNHLVLDVETFALDDAAQFIEEPSAPSNYKDEAKIAAYVAEARAKAISKCALDADLCRVVCIGMLQSNGVVAETMRDEKQERDSLKFLWSHVKQADALVGFNLLAFDLPVLIRRSQYLGVPVPRLNLDRYRTPHFDLLEILTFNGKLKYRSLDFYCRRFGIDVPDPVNGKDIDALVRAGDWQAVADHCRADVEKTRKLAERIGVLAAVEVA